jgi:hypothetical protein
MGLLRRGQVRWSIVRDAFFLVGLVVIFVLQLVEGLAIIAHAADAGAVDTIGGIGRSWELIGGPQFGIGHEVTALVRGQHDEPADEDKHDEPADEDKTA